MYHVPPPSNMSLISYPKEKGGRELKNQRILLIYGKGQACLHYEGR